MSLRVLLLAGVASAALFSPACAADNSAFLQGLAAMPRVMPPAQVATAETAPVVPTSTPPRPVKPAHVARPIAARASAPVEAPSSVSALEHKVAEQQAQIAVLMARVDAVQSAPAPKPQEAPAPKPDAAPAAKPSDTVTVSNGRPTFASADGRFTLAVRALGQFDSGYYAQGSHAAQLAAANGPDLSSGQNFRRAHLGVQGKVFGDWNYQFNYDFGGSSGTESPGRIQAAWVEYAGLAPFAVRIGAFPASASIEDNTSAGDTLFLERNAPAELARNIAGGDGRDAIAVTYSTDRIYGSVAFTGNKIADTGSFDEQEALLARLSGVAYSDDQSKLVVSVNGTYVVKLADTAAGPGAPASFTLAATPELTVDNSGTKLVSTGAINASHVFQWGLETAGQWKNFYGQAGYFGFDVSQRTAGAPSLSFGGWYAQASWVITGESRSYNPASGAFTNPKPAKPFALDGSGWGAFEVAARYSDLNLNDNEGTIGSPVPAGGIRGGDQRVVSLGVNWFPNSALRFELQAQNVQISRIGTIPAGAGHGVLTNANVGQAFNTVALRSQISL